MHLDKVGVKLLLDPLPHLSKPISRLATRLLCPTGAGTGVLRSGLAGAGGARKGQARLRESKLERGPEGGGVQGGDGVRRCRVRADNTEASQSSGCRAVLRLRATLEDSGYFRRPADTTGV